MDPSEPLLSQLIWIESPTNPTLRLIDIPRIVAIARAHPSHPLVVVDNTFMSPFYSSPLLQDADIVIHSLTKYINGHTDVVMGAAILPKHHTALYERLAFLQYTIGAIPGAYDSWLAQRGAKTLPDEGARAERAVGRPGTREEPLRQGGHLPGPSFASTM